MGTVQRHLPAPGRSGGREGVVSSFSTGASVDPPCKLANCESALRQASGPGLSEGSLPVECPTR